MKLTQEELRALRRELADGRVLSVYVAREADDPGLGEIWSKRLSAEAKLVRQELERSAPDDVPAFDSALEQVREATSDFGRILPAPGWVAFATPTAVRYRSDLPYQPRTLVRWREGLFSAPLVRGFERSRPVVLALMDDWNARLLDLEDGAPVHELLLRTGQDLAESTDGISNRAATATGFSGQRGETATDAARQALEADTKKLRARVVEAVIKKAGDEGVVVLGGISRPVRAVMKALEPRLAGRFAEVPELSFDMSLDELVTKAGEAASAITSSRQATRLEACRESIDRGSTGWNDTHRALAVGAVDTLLLACPLIDSAPDDAEVLVDLALAHGSTIEEVGGTVGERLMEEAGGVAAELRFRPSALAM